MGSGWHTKQIAAPLGSVMGMLVSFHAIGILVSRGAATSSPSGSRFSSARGPFRSSWAAACSPKFRGPKNGDMFIKKKVG